MGTRILKIDGEMPEINECKVGNPQISISRNWANLSQPWILTFFEDEIFKPFFQFHVSEVPYQNEKLPIVYGIKKPKTLGTVQKMTVLQAWEIYKTFWNTRYRWNRVHVVNAVRFKLVVRKTPWRWFKSFIMEVITRKWLSRILLRYLIVVCKNYVLWLLMVCFLIEHFIYNVVLWLENNCNNLKIQVLILLVSHINFMLTTQILIFIVCEAYL